MGSMRAYSPLNSTHRVRKGAGLLGLVLACFAAPELGALGTPGASDPPAGSQNAGLWMTVNTQRFAVTLEDNPTAHAFVQLLPTTLDMAELNGNEKHARLPRSLPSNPARPGTIRSGDVLLYGDDTLVVFYETFSSSYSYTRIGRITESTGLAQALGPGDQRVTFTTR